MVVDKHSDWFPNYCMTMQLNHPTLTMNYLANKSTTFMTKKHLKMNHKEKEMMQKITMISNIGNSNVNSYESNEYHPTQFESNNEESKNLDIGYINLSEGQSNINIDEE